jgi:hypothetical protein
MRQGLAWLGAAILLAACSEQPKPTESHKPPEPANGRYQMLELPNGVANFNNPREPAVWLLDTRTGKMSVCWFNEKGMNISCYPPPVP